MRRRRPFAQRAVTAIAGWAAFDGRQIAALTLLALSAFLFGMFVY